MVLAAALVPAAQSFAAAEPDASGLDRRVAFDIARQPLDLALIQYARQSGVQVLSSAPILDRKITPGLKGIETPREALQKLLKGSNLAFAVTAANTVAIIEAVPPSPARPERTAPEPLARASPPVIDRTPVEIDRGPVVEEVVVTAERREAFLEQTPIALSVLRGQALEDEARLTIEDALATAPAVQIRSQAVFGSVVFIRGLGPLAGGDSAVNMTVDGVYQTDGAIAAQYDLARIEILRGPQGTLYGRNATAGAVNIITNDPVQGFSARTTATVGSDETVRVDGVVNAPLGDTLALRTAFLSSRHAGFLDNGDQDEDVQAVRAKLLWRPSPTLRALFTADYAHLGGAGPGAVPLPLEGRPDPRATPDQRGAVDSAKTSAYATVDADLGWGVLTWQPAYYRYANRVDADLFAIGLIYTDQDSREHTEELRIASPEADPVKWLAGLYYLDWRQDVFPLANGIASGVHSPLKYPYVVSSPNRAHSYAAFAQVTAPLTDRFRVTGGLRYTVDRKSVGGTKYLAPDQPDPGLASAVFRRTDDAVTYKAGVEYDLAPRSMAYAQISRGYRAGGVNAVASSPTPNGGVPVPTTYAPEYLTSVEAGLKSRPWRNLQVDGAAYHYGFDNQQVVSVVLDPLGGPPIRQIENAAKVTLYGLELEARWAASARDRFTASLTYNHTRFDRFLYQSTVYAPGPSYTLDRAGEREPNAPMWTGALGYEHTFPMPGGATVTAAGDLRLYSSQNVSIEPIAGRRQPGYHETDAHLEYAAAGGRWSLRAYVTNLENNVVRVSALFAGAGWAQLAPPRLYGLALEARF